MNKAERAQAIYARMAEGARRLTAERDEARAQRDGMASWIRQARSDMERARRLPAESAAAQRAFAIASLDRALALLDCPAHDERTHVCQLRTPQEILAGAVTRAHHEHQSSHDPLTPTPGCQWCANAHAAWKQRTWQLPEGG